MAASTTNGTAPRTKVALEAMRLSDTEEFVPSRPVTLEIEGEYVFVGAGHGKRAVKCQEFIHALRLVEAHYQSYSRGIAV
jgi:hypothetical protein